jgi:hypothetical protein
MRRTFLEHAKMARLTTTWARFGFAYRKISETLIFRCRIGVLALNKVFVRVRDILSEMKRRISVAAQLKNPPRDAAEVHAPILSRFTRTGIVS